MKWEDRRRSSNMEDRRGQSRGPMFRPRGGGSGIRLPSGRGAQAGGGGIGLIIIVLVVGLFLGVNPLELLSGNVPTQTQTQTNAPGRNASDDQLFDFMSVVAAETETLWTEVFRQNNMRYQPATVVVYSGQTQAGCGVADARMGPFYCPADQKVYVDLSFYDTLRQQFGAPGDFAQAYVLAHEIGHHVQQLTGVLPEFNAARGRLSQEQENAWSIKVELQADCYAGIWANYAGSEDLLERGDIQEALNAALQIGDDTLQERMQGFAVPKTFNHGTSEQRKRWFETGYRSGDVGACDTFNAARL